MSRPRRPFDPDAWAYVRPRAGEAYQPLDIHAWQDGTPFCGNASTSQVGRWMPPPKSAIAAGYCPQCMNRYIARYAAWKEMSR